MATAEITNERAGATQTKYIELPKWQQFDDTTYQCRVLLCPEEDGGGVGSEFAHF